MTQVTHPKQKVSTTGLYRQLFVLPVTRVSGVTFEPKFTLQRQLQPHNDKQCFTFKKVSGTIEPMSEILDAIRQAIERSDTSRYRMSKELDISQAQLSKLMTGKGGLSLESLEMLAEYLELEITIKPKHNERKGK